MTLEELIKITKNIIDETDTDEQIDIIIKSAINEAYTALCGIDKRVSTAYIPIINGIAELPSDFITMVSSTPSLKDIDTIVGNSVITSNTGTLNITYSYSREPLVNLTDEPDLNPSLVSALYNYAAYKYWLHRKKDNVAMLFLQSYNNSINSFIINSSNNIPEYVTDIRGDY